MNSNKINAPLDDLIRGEKSAVEGYNKVLSKIKDSNEVSKLRDLKADHEKALTTLQKYASAEIKMHATDSGPWGTFVEAFTGTASFFGDKAAVAALKVGEQHGVMEYKDALADDTVTADLKEVIRTQLLPVQERHIQVIENFK